MKAKAVLKHDFAVMKKLFCLFRTENMHDVGPVLVDKHIFINISF